MNASNCIVHSEDCISCTWFCSGSGCSNNDCSTCPNTCNEGHCHCLEKGDENDEHCPYYKKEV